MARLKHLLKSMIFIKCLIAVVKCRVSIKYNITEADPVNEKIGNIPDDTNLRSRFSPDVFSTIKYNFLPNSRYINFLDLDQNTGVLRIKQKFDREQICNDKSVCDIKLYVATEPVVHRVIIEVTIHIKDVNDNAPRFEEPYITLDISENVPPGITKYTLPQASDPDHGNFNIKGYRLVPPIDKFSLEVLNNPVGSADLHLKLLKKLDREIIDHYSLKVLAWDGGVPAKTGTLSISINVMDSNDNAPQFTQPIYDVQVRENLPKGSTLLFVKAIDPDHNSNGDVIYTFSKSTASSYNHLFDINEDTGEIYTVGNLDYEQASVYYLSVVASDKGINSFSSIAKVIINVTDENDNAPIISVSGLGKLGKVEIRENSDTEITVALVHVTDPEDGTHSRVTCSMISDTFMLKDIDDNQYEIVTAVSFNREDNDVYRIILSCKDHGLPPKTADQHITVFVTDANDNPPVFEKNQYDATLFENSASGVSVITVNAIDKDVDENADITYSILSLINGSHLEDSTRLMINSKNGSIVTTDNFDREKQTYHKYLVVATDNGSPKMNATAILNIKVLDVNDEPPKFAESQGPFGTYENQKVGTEIGTVTANDSDLSPHDVISYSIVSSTRDSNNAFIINNETGKITTQKMLNREVNNEYHLVIMASNPGKPHLRSKANITIYVIDENDNAPYFTFPRPGNNTVKLNNNIKKGGTVTYILARDADMGKNAAITYSISKGNKEGYFDINMEGEVFLTRNLDIPKGISIFNLDITVSDKGDTPLYSTQTLRIIANGTAFNLDTSSAHQIISLSGNTNILIAVLCSGLVVIVFTVILLFILLAMRRKKDHQARMSRNIPERRNSSSCMETTKALLTMGGLPQPPNADDPQMDPEASPEHESMDSGVDMPPMEDPRQGNHDMLTWGKQREKKCHQSSDMPVLMEMNSPVQCGLLPTIEEQPDNGSPRKEFYGNQKPYTVKGSGEMTEIQLRVHEMLYNLNNVSHDADSSASDSGKGPSEEGDIRDNHEELELCDMKYPTSYATSPGSLKNPSRHLPPLKYQPLQTSPTHSPMFNTTNMCQTFPKKTQACKPILKPSQSQDPNNINSSSHIPPESYNNINEQQNKPFNNNLHSNNKKKTVHFVKPYSKEKDFQQHPVKTESLDKLNQLSSKPSYIYCPSPKPLHNKIRGLKNKNIDSGNNTMPNYPAETMTDYYNQRPTNHQYFDIWGNENDEDSQDGYSDGGTTTSGSYCMDTTAEEQPNIAGCFSIDGYQNQNHDVFV